MTTKITETRMSSDATTHTATARPVPGEPTLWSVTWLPGRSLTRDQAITAMTIAETVTGRPATQKPGSLPLPANRAPARTNQAGSLCPSWGTSYYAKIQAHMSDPMTSSPPGESQVKIVQRGGGHYHSEQPTLNVFTVF